MHGRPPASALRPRSRSVETLNAEDLSVAFYLWSYRD
jgi:hypothetical protein